MMPSVVYGTGSDSSNLLKPVKRRRISIMSTSRVLVVDDDPSTRRFVSASFQARGFDVIEADDSESALKIVKQHRPDMVILDIMMPGIDGIEVCDHIRQWSEAPIVFLDR
jgi:CheY-like chemotaxis protein